MRDLVDGQEEVLVGRGAKNVANCPELPGPKGCVAKEMREVDLEGDDAGDDVLGQGLGTAELRDLTALLADGSPEWTELLCTSGCALIMASRLVL